MVHGIVLQASSHSRQFHHEENLLMRENIGENFLIPTSPLNRDAHREVPRH